MVKFCPSLVFFFLAALVLAQVPAVDKKEGPVLYGDGSGRLWKWQGGEKTWLSPEGRNFVLGGVGEESLWGYSLEGDKARFFTQELPKKGKLDPKAKASPPPVPRFDSSAFQAPELADKAGDRTLLVWSAHDHPRYEVWKGAEKLTARAWDDGRTVYALSLGPQDGWMIAGRTATGEPWLEVSGAPVPAPEGWRGRLTVALWVAEKQDKKDASADIKTKDPKAPKPLPPVHPWAAGWGAPEGEPARALFWGPEGWTEPEVSPDSPLAGGVYPLLGIRGDGGLLLAGWQADAGTGALRPWFWDGEAKVPGGAADGQPQAFGAGDKGSFLVVRHQSAPWFTLEDGTESTPLEGLGPDDRIVAVEAAKASP